MQKVLMIAHSFPPEGNAGAYRPLRFVRRLPLEGWQASVITADKDHYERFDPELNALVPEGVDVVRVRNRDPWYRLQARRTQQTKAVLRSNPQKGAATLAKHRGTVRSMLRRCVRKFESCCYHPDLDMGWIRPAVNAVVRYAERNPVTVIWATAGPVSSVFVAGRASRLTGIPYVLDFRDAWTIKFNEFECGQPQWAQRANRANMRRLVENARALIFAYEAEAECFWRVYSGAIEPPKVHLIPNGYEGAIKPKKVAQHSLAMTVFYGGTLGDYKVDTLIEALGVLKREDNNLRQQIQFSFVGEGTDAVAALSQRYGVEDCVSYGAPVSHGEAVNLADQADVLLALGRFEQMKGFEMFAPAKLFGYLSAGRPILGILPADEAVNILRRVGVTTVADVNSVSEIVRVLRELMSAHNGGRLMDLVPDPAACQRYSICYQTRCLTRALAGDQSLESFIPGRSPVPPSLIDEVPKLARETLQKGKFLGSLVSAIVH